MAPRRPSRLGIFGGTFDPPHAGHAAAAVCARDQLGTEVLYAVVANDPWQKSARRCVTPADHRLAMARLAFGALAGIDVSATEIDRGGPTYTHDTVAELERPGLETVLVVGREAVGGLSTWHRPAELAQRVTLAVVQPPGETPVRPQGWRVLDVTMDPVPVSATSVRGLLADPDPERVRAAVADLVHPAVIDYLLEHHLYAP